MEIMDPLHRSHEWLAEAIIVANLSSRDIGCRIALRPIRKRETVKGWKNSASSQHDSFTSAAVSSWFST
ncbi:hypothetical protein EMEDMD4_1180004 [Sinorhizobium medicae]|uniref:Uncharacterized protein n=1 Tax=Sinorhizobium medicae TaxID=110321 RepID=A0A508WQY2_9HYPH|nr:hypothetical protein EMEDMD4_1180004 [Sinorhizobium medicae]